MTATSLTSTITLNDGVKIPQLGLGVYEMDDKETVQSVTWALEAGVRHVDSATWYENEDACKKAIEGFCEKSGVPRSDIFYTTKLREPTTYDKAVECIKYSCEHAPGGYVDLYLMHSAIGGPKLREESWRAFEWAKKEKLVRSIGVSNWGVKHIEEHVERVADSSKSDIISLPSINQIDLHPFMTREDVVSICRKHGIHMEAWAPLVRALRFKHPVVVKVAEAHNVSPAQALIRWSLQKGFVCIPKSVSQNRIKQNTDVFGFELTEAEVKEFDALDEFLVTDWEVSTVE